MKSRAVAQQALSDSSGWQLHFVLVPLSRAQWKKHHRAAGQRSRGDAGTSITNNLSRRQLSHNLVVADVRCGTKLDMCVGQRECDLAGSIKRAADIEAYEVSVPVYSIERLRRVVTFLELDLEEG